MTDDQILISQISAYYKIPKRGEIVVFKGDGKRLIKRLIGLPGEEVNLIDGYVYIDGEKLDESAYLSDEVRTYEEYHPAYERITYPYIIPEDSYLFLGDNRGDSLDGRVFGTIKKDTIISIGGYRIYPFDKLGFIE